MSRWLWLCCLAACSASTPDAAEPPGETAVSEHVVGNFIVYRYSGSFSPEPVTLREAVTEAHGLQLRIEVEAERGEEKRRWVQVVTDTQENRDNNVVDELYEDVGGALRPLDTNDRSVLYGLYAWTLPPCTEQLEELPAEERAIDVVGIRMQCRCERQRMQCQDRPTSMTLCDCPELVWEHAFAEAVVEGETAPLWRMEITATGRR